MGDAEKSAARRAMAAALRASDEANLCTQLHGEKGMERDVRLAWAALRDCVEVGKEHRYSEAQLVYHYTKDREGLLAALEAHLGRPFLPYDGSRTRNWREDLTTLTAAVVFFAAAIPLGNWLGFVEFPVPVSWLR